MVKTPNLSPATEETAVHAEYHHRSERTQGPHTENEARTPSEQEVEDAHSAARLRRSLAHRDRPGPLLLAHHRVCSRLSLHRGEASCLFRPKEARPEAVARRFGENERIERLVEGESPTSRGWLRSRWSCKLLAYELFKERATLVSRETIRRALHRLGFRWRRPRPVPPEKSSEEQQQRKRQRLEDVLQMAKSVGSFFQDETKL